MLDVVEMLQVVKRRLSDSLDKLALKELQQNIVLGPADAASVRMQRLLFDNCLDPVTRFSREAEDANTMRRVTHIRDDLKAAACVGYLTYLIERQRTTTRHISSYM